MPFSLRLELSLELHLNCFLTLFTNSIVWAWFEGQGTIDLSGVGPLISKYLHIWFKI